MQRLKKLLNCRFVALKLSTELTRYSFCNILFIKLINLWLKIYQNQNYYKLCRNMCLQQIMPHKHLHVQSQKRKQQTVARNMSKANNKDTRTTSLTSLLCPHHHLRPYPTPHSSDPIFDPKKTNVYWPIINRENTPRVKPTELY